MASVFIPGPDFIQVPEAQTFLDDAFDRIDCATSRGTALAEFQASPHTYDALIVGVKEKITESLLANSPKLKVIGTLSVGIDHIDTDAVEKRGIKLVTTRGINASAVAEHALMLILTLLKDTLNGHVAVLNGKDRKGLSARPRDLTGKAVGILGAGNTARAMIRYLAPFNCRVRVWTRNPSNHQDLLDQGIEFSSADEVFARSDVVSVHLAFTEEMAEIFSSKRLLSLPEGAIFVNCSRNRLVDQDVLQKILEARPDLRIGIDDFELGELSYVKRAEGKGVFTPHIAGATQEALDAMEIHVAKRLAESVK